MTSAGETDLPQHRGDLRKVKGEVRRAHLTVAEAKLLPAQYERGWNGFRHAWKEDGLLLLGILFTIP